MFTRVCVHVVLAITEQGRGPDVTGHQMCFIMSEEVL